MPSDEKSRTRRICGLAALSVTALGTLLGAAPAEAQPSAPPGQMLQEMREAQPGTLASYTFKQGWPVKWEGAERQVYDWWQKIEPSP